MMPLSFIANLSPFISKLNRIIANFFIFLFLISSEFFKKKCSLPFTARAEIKMFPDLNQIKYQITFSSCNFHFVILTKLMNDVFMNHLN